MEALIIPVVGLIGNLLLACDPGPTDTEPLRPAESVVIRNGDPAPEGLGTIDLDQPVIDAEAIEMLLGNKK